MSIYRGFPMISPFKLFAVAAFAIAPLAAGAGTINAAGTYDLSNINFESLAQRGIWTGGSGLVSGGDASNLWDVESGGGTFTINTDDTAMLMGVATNIGTDGALNTDLQFTYSLQFDFVSDLIADPQVGYCQFGGPKAPCASAPPNVSILDWDFFNLTSGSFDFLGAYSAVEYVITDRSGGTHKAQAGKNAMALIADDQNGFSMWFDASLKSGQTSTTISPYTFSNKNGDFNVYISPSPVPLPAAGWLLIAGLGGLAAMKRRETA